MKNTKRTLCSILATCGYVLLMAGLSSCTDESGARKALERNNYQPIKVGGYDWLGGSKGDVYITKFEAIAPNGDTVSGCVTKGLWKGSTIRLDD
jgi:hypothetical protein